MPKRMIDTDLWNNEDIIENFTAEDKYFWLYLLTNPHNKMCGVLKNSPALIARDMGLHKDTIVNLIYRFERVHKVIACDKETNEIFILNWHKFNWTKSPKVISIVEREKNDVKSTYISSLIEDRLSVVLGGKEDTVSIGYPYPPNSNTNTINNNSISKSISIIFEHWNSKDIIKHRELTKEIETAITKALKIYDSVDIKDYIDRYYIVISDETYFFNYKWTLKDFLTRKDGISSFTDEGSKWVSYCEHIDKANKPSQNGYDRFMSELAKLRED